MDIRLKEFQNMMKGNYVNSNSFDIYAKDQSDILKNLTYSLDIINKTIMTYSDVINKIEVEILASKAFKDVCQNELRSLDQEIQSTKKDSDARIFKFITDLHTELDTVNRGVDQIRNTSSVKPSNYERMDENSGLFRYANDPNKDEQNRTMYQINQ